MIRRLRSPAEVAGMAAQLRQGERRAVHVLDQPRVALEMARQVEVVRARRAARAISCPAPRVGPEHVRHRIGTVTVLCRWERCYEDVPRRIWWIARAGVVEVRGRSARGVVRDLHHQRARHREQVAATARYAASAAAKEAIREARRPRPGLRDPDGGLRGVRVMAVSADGRMVSPHRGTPWPGPALRAEAWSDDAAVRGVSGVHAVWPAAQEWRPRSDYTPAQSEYGILVDAEVCGYGRTVQGTEGWRAELVILQRVYAHHESMRAAVAARYPEVEVVVGRLRVAQEGA